VVVEVVVEDLDPPVAQDLQVLQIQEERDLLQILHQVQEL
jgi:hypothetical protein